MLTTVPLHAADGLEKKVRSDLAATGGRWWGSGARLLELTPGTPVDIDTLVDLYTSFRDPRFQHLPFAERPLLGPKPGRYITTAQHRERLSRDHPELTDSQLNARSRELTRSPLLCLDLTFAPPKSTAVAHAAFQAAAEGANQRGALEEAFTWHQKAAAVREAVLVGNEAMLDVMQDLAGTARAGAQGATTMEAKGWVVASFLRTWNQARDPFLYVRNLVLNRVERADGKWRSFDSSLIMKARAWGAAVGERATSEALVDLLGLGLVRRTEGGSLEIEGIPEPVLELFSVRAAQVQEAATGQAEGPRMRTTRIPAMLTSVAADQEHRHRIPGDLVRWWQQRLEEEGLPDLVNLAAATLEPGTPTKLSSGDVRKAQQAVAALGVAVRSSIRQQGWIALQINNHLPASLGGLSPTRVRGLLAEAVATYRPSS
ncbi:MobF family relaxase [Nocardiopsis sp. NPDC006938]|uniref:MobF family relaxase n=1 Tax=Nocardiopsis sp. NPDC006938 TaxID=3364337 RepID=UPI00367535B9